MIVWLALAASVRAEGRLKKPPDGMLACANYVDCTEDESLCTGLDACESVSGGSGRICTVRDGLSRDFLCCDPALGGEAQCPEPGICIPLEDETGFCHDAERTLCLPESVTVASLGSVGVCFEETSWALGDCDDDGIDNQDERPGCVCENADTTMVTACHRDGDGDAGGGGGSDAGPNRDAGGRAPTAGGYIFRGSGGCTCESAGGDADAPWLVAGIGLLIGLATRRRRHT